MLDNNYQKIIISLVLILIFGGCTFSTTPQPITKDTKPSCSPPYPSSIELGNPVRGYSMPAQFTTDGSEIFVTARYYDHRFLSMLGKGVSEIYIGNANIPPQYDPQRGVVSNVLNKFVVRENSFNSTSLPPGKYWLWSSSGGDIFVVSCTTNGVSNPLPRR